MERPRFINIFLMILCSLSLCGCVSILADRKVAVSSEKKTGATAGLVKPRLAAAEDTSTAKTSGNPDKGKLEEKKAAPGGDPLGEKVASAVRNPGPLGKRDEAKDLPAEKKSNALIKPVRQVSDETLPDKRVVVESEPSPKPDRGKQAPVRSDDKNKESDDVAFKKHDHAKYISTIRGKAIDQLNREKAVTLARVCRDTTTEEWSLVIYRKRDKTYSFVSYVWDEIDGKWEEALPSGPRPISGWKHHLDFSSAGKECQVLKGTLP
ncbi:MAG: hypothetical protein HY913_16815 [Desulfomonile tiedjei]|nr:hypothetical protein [Desulfomonile tiedjei]